MSLAVLLSLLLGFAGSQNPLRAEEAVSQTQQQRVYDAGEKWKRGATNIITFPADFFYEFHKAASKEDQSQRLLGFVGAVFVPITRLGAGLVDLLTFPFNFPDPRKAPLIEPEYFWE